MLIKTRLEMVAIMQPEIRTLPSTFFLLVWVSFLIPVGHADTRSHAQEAFERRLLGLIEYISGDYPGAVVDGKVISETEFAEMQEFARTAEESFHTLETPIAHQSEIVAALHDLNLCIAQKCAHDKVLVLTRFLRDEFISAFGISSAPSQRPSFVAGKEIFGQHCASCHGAQGAGDGPLAAGLRPAPRSFYDADYLRHASPFKYYNTLHTGISGTAMLSFESVLTQDQMWSVSFYLMSLHYHQSREASAVTDESAKLWAKLAASDSWLLPPDLGFLARHTNQELQTWLDKGHPTGAKASVLADAALTHLDFLRNFAPYAPQLPIRLGQASSSNFPWDFIQKHIQTAKEQFQAGSYAEANGTLLDAYLEGFENIEALLAVADHSLLLNVERSFSLARSYAAKGQVKEFELAILALEKLVEQAHVKLGQHSQQKEVWGSGDFLSALIIILREGFEAFLIIVALLMIVKNMNAPRARLWIHAGWLLAVVFGLASYVLFEKILKLSGATRESIEAFCTLTASIVLFYTGFWLLSQAEHSRWQKYIKQKTGYAISTQRLWILAGISFLAVFRESCETVLFYSALLSTAQSSYVVLSGFLAGLLILSLFCLAILKFNVRLPLKQFFFTTSLFMVLLSVVLAGKAVNELVAAGYLKATPLNFVPLIDILGLYPLQETFFAQCLVLAIALLLLLKKNFFQAKVLQVKNAN